MVLGTAEKAAWDDPDFGTEAKDEEAVEASPMLKEETVDDNLKQKESAQT